ncbi:alpha/beta hydrolase [Massilia atriviolacea]|nr:alpha/beta hydrolase [Massilia atriviolacea]
MTLHPSGLNIHIAGAGPSFLWAHGMMGSMAAEDALGILRWDRFPATWRLLRYDARGHGASAASTDPRQHTWPQLARDMLAVADAGAAASFVGGGWSMGCATVLHAALQAPARIQGLVLMLPPAVWEGRSAQAALYRRALRLCQAVGPARFARLAATDAGLPPWLLQAAPRMGAAMRDATLRMAAPSIPCLFEGAARSDLPPREALAALAAVPALIVAWPGDPAHPLAAARELHRLLPRSSLLIAATHDEVLGIPDALQRFLRTIGAPEASTLTGSV